MMALAIFFFLLGAVFMGIVSCMIDLRHPTASQQLRTYERRQRVAAARDQLAMNMAALDAIRRMQRRYYDEER